MDSHAIVVRRLPDAPARRQAAVKAAPSLRSRVTRRAGRILLNLLFALTLATAGIMLVPAVLGFQRYIILTGSMTGTYDRYSIVYDLPVPVSSLKVGDPITYNPPTGYTSGVYKRVTHRIWWIGRGANGERAFRTKGDFNKEPDVWKFTLGNGTQDKVIFHVPYMGYFFLLLGLKEFREGLVGIPAVLMALFMIRGLWREGGAEAKRQKLASAGWQQVDDPGPEVILPPVASPAQTRLPARLVFAALSVPRRTLVGAAAGPAHMPGFQQLRVRRLADRASGPAHGPEPVAAAPAPNDSAAACRLRVLALVLGGPPMPARLSA